MNRIVFMPAAEREIIFVEAAERLQIRTRRPCVTKSTRPSGIFALLPSPGRSLRFPRRTQKM
jgi:hypothetical protein